MKITLKNIQALDLPLDNDSKLMERGTSFEVLCRLEEKYGRKSHKMFLKTNGQYNIYTDPKYKNISESDKDMWLVNYEVYIRSSVIYVFWIYMHIIKSNIEEKKAQRI